MERAFIFISLLTIMECSIIQEYHYVSEALTWKRAQAYCREHYDEMAIVESQGDQKALEKAAGTNSVSGFFGLHRDMENVTGWKWSGGGYVTYTNWQEGRPNNLGQIENMGQVTSRGWNDYIGDANLPFYCMSLPTVEKVKKNWEEAEEYCRESDSSLVSLRSDTELLLLQRLMKEQGHDRIWIGLRFPTGGWLWTNGDPLAFQAWSEEEKDIQCPRLQRCAALTAEGRWETLDCQEKLLFMCNGEVQDSSQELPGV